MLHGKGLQHVGLNLVVGANAALTTLAGLGEWLPANITECRRVLGWNAAAVV